MTKVGGTALAVRAEGKGLPTAQPARAARRARTLILAVIAATLLLAAILILDNSVADELGRRAVEQGVIR